MNQAVATSLKFDLLLQTLPRRFGGEIQSFLDLGELSFKLASLPAQFVCNNFHESDSCNQFEIWFTSTNLREAVIYVLAESIR